MIRDGRRSVGIYSRIAPKYLPNAGRGKHFIHGEVSRGSRSDGCGKIRSGRQILGTFDVCVLGLGGP